MLYFHKSRGKLCDTWIILILFILQGQNPGDQISEGKSKLKGVVIEAWRCLEVAEAAGHRRAGTKGNITPACVGFMRRDEKLEAGRPIFISTKPRRAAEFGQSGKRG